MKLWVDDERPAPRGWRRARTVAQALKLLDTGKISEISLDHDLGENERTGYFLAALIEERAHDGQLRRLVWHIHSANPVGRKKMLMALQSADRLWDSNAKRNKP